MRVFRSNRILAAKEESDRIAKEEAYANQIPGITCINAGPTENNTKDECCIDTVSAENNSGSRSQHDGQNGLGESRDESDSDDEESEYEFEQSDDESGTNNETFLDKTREHESRKENHCERNGNKFHGNSRLKARLQFKKMRQIIQHNVGPKRTVGGEKRHKCQQCHYAANHKNYLTRHMRSHTGEKPYKCGKCNYAAAQPTNLIRHARIHSGEKPYKCQFCKYATTQNSNLVRHNRIHTGEKPYKCHFCQHASSYGHSLNLHMRTQHKGALKLRAAKARRVLSVTC
ncbi:zinc-finger double domain-containing protein [Ditylenchus destructor]|uniref:Zinc-finger double domain-containing protein n=1 Tax=Ditylenchus destructor TaxID=166010 RepID=A0AAD4MQR7_9BILA|nr:zinc-finger double domain-containing protein [Ditylenchus destructor]